MSFRVSALAAIARSNPYAGVAERLTLSIANNTEGWITWLALQAKSRAGESS